LGRKEIRGGGRGEEGLGKDWVNGMVWEVFFLCGFRDWTKKSVEKGAFGWERFEKFGWLCELN
jgi:hypothetical protein